MVLLEKMECAYSNCIVDPRYISSKKSNVLPGYPKCILVPGKLAKQLFMLSCYDSIARWGEVRWGGRRFTAKILPTVTREHGVRVYEHKTRASHTACSLEMPCDGCWSREFRLLKLIASRKSSQGLGTPCANIQKKTRGEHKTLYNSKLHGPSPESIV